MNSRIKISILGCGWLGLPLAKTLIAKDFEVKGSTTSESKIGDLNKLSIDSFLINLNHLSNSALDYFLSSEILIFTVPPGKMESIESLSILKIAIQKSPIQKIILLSSTGIYKNLNSIVDEKDDENTLKQESGLFKIETFFKQLNNIELTTLRLAGLIAKDRNPVTFMQKNNVISNPEHPLNYVHAQDVCEIIKSIVQENIWGKTFNCCSDQHPKKSILFREIAKKNNLEEPLFSSKNGPFKIIDNSKIKRMLNFQFRELNQQNFN